MVAHDPVHVWIADLDAAASERRAASLSDDERARAEELAGARARERWIASRGILRALVGDFAGLDPQALRFVLGPHGKPRLVAAPHRRGTPCFNASHSGSIAVYALAWDREVGIDVELAARRRPSWRDELAIARRLLGGEVERRLAGLPQSQRTDAFLREWTAYEAGVKCLGVGIGAGRAAAAAGRLSELSVTEIDVGEGAFAALASEGAPAGVQVGRWG